MPLPNATISMLRASASQACAMLKTMAHKDHLLLLCQLTQDEHSVGELETLVGLRQPGLSQQLDMLRDEGLVATRRGDKHICYRLAGFEVTQIMQTLSGLYYGKVMKKMTGR